MAFTIPISSLVSQYLALIPAGTDWKDIKFWSTYDGRHLSLNEIPSEHVINIARRIVNEAVKGTEIQPIPIKNPLANINFAQAPVYEWVLFCKVLVSELETRDTEVSATYHHIYCEVCDRIDKLTIKHPLSLLAGTPQLKSGTC
jgi:hypothetical protein